MRKLTVQRKAILDLINNSNRHWDAEEVSHALAEEGIIIGIATIYRGLAALDHDGMINSVQVQNKRHYEHANKEHHDHLVCSDCGSIDEFTNDDIERQQKRVASERNFHMSGHQLIIFGLCKSCAGKQ